MENMVTLERLVQTKKKNKKTSAFGKTYAKKVFKVLPPKKI